MRCKLPALPIVAALLLLSACAEPTAPGAALMPSASVLQNGVVFGSGNRGGDEGGTGGTEGRTAPADPDGEQTEATSDNGGMYGSGGRGSEEPPASGG